MIENGFVDILDCPVSDGDYLVMAGLSRANTVIKFGKIVKSNNRRIEVVIVSVKTDSKQLSLVPAYSGECVDLVAKDRIFKTSRESLPDAVVAALDILYCSHVGPCGFVDMRKGVEI